MEGRERQCATTIGKTSTTTTTGHLDTGRNVSCAWRKKKRRNRQCWFFAGWCSGFTDSIGANPALNKHSTHNNRTHNNSTQHNSTQNSPSHNGCTTDAIVFFGLHFLAFSRTNNHSSPTQPWTVVTVFPRLTTVARRQQQKQQQKQQQRGSCGVLPTSRQQQKKQTSPKQTTRGHTADRCLHGRDGRQDSIGKKTVVRLQKGKKVMFCKAGWKGLRSKSFLRKSH